MRLPLPMRPMMAASGSEPSFSPADLSPVGWWDGQDDTTITEASALVSSWASKGSVTCTADTAADYPTLTASAINGHQALLFDASGLSLSADLVTSLSDLTFYAVVNGVPTSGDQYIFDTAVGRLFLLSDATWRYFNGSFVDSGDANDGGAHLLTYIFSSGGTTIRLDGVEIYSGAGLQETISGATAIGGRNDGSTSFNLSGYLGELVIFDSAHSGDDLADMETYLSVTGDKWGA